MECRHRVLSLAHYEVAHGREADGGRARETGISRAYDPVVTGPSLSVTTDSARSTRASCTSSGPRRRCTSARSRCSSASRSTAPDGRFRLDDVRELVASRLPLIPRFRTPGRCTCRSALGRPIWVDDPSFDIARHVHLTRLPAPGRRRQLLALAERLMEQILDRDHPLWELWFVEGVDGGEHVGLDPQVASHAHRRHLRHRHRHRAARLLAPSRPCSTHRDWQPEPAPDPARLMIDSRVRADHVNRSSSPVARDAGVAAPAPGRRPRVPARAFDRLAGRRRSDRAHAVAQRADRARPPHRDGARPARRVRTGEQGVRVHRQRRRARRRSAARSPACSTRAASSPPTSSVKVFCPVSVRDDERAHAARQPDLGDVRAPRGR